MPKKIDSQTVKKIAYLSRLSNSYSDQELQKYAEELGAVLDLADQLAEVDTNGINPLDGLRTIKIDDLRNDEPNPDQDQYNQTRAAIINNFPNRQGDLLVVPGIFE
jgi:aspartyl-tRNA(Asn)/glutamyl-tRNA(Gln) amidotransferase subunit C